MKKCIIETVPTKTGETLGYLELSTGQVIHSRRPTVVPSSAFVNEHIGNGKFHLLVSGLPEEADDAEFAKFLKDSDGDKELAVAAFASKFDVPVVDTPSKPAAKPKRQYNRKKK